jgi:hypothetical protein
LSCAIISIPSFSDTMNLTGEGGAGGCAAVLRQTEGVTGSHQNWRRGETRERAAQKGTTGRQEERLKGPRAQAAGGSLAPRPQTSNQITAPRRSTRALKRVKRQEAAKQQTAKGSNWPELQGNPQGALSLQETKRERHVRGQSQACCTAAGMFTTKRLGLSGLSGTSATPRKGWSGETLSQRWSLSG